MARYIDADMMREDWLKNGENEYVYDTNAVLQSIDNQPTVDVVEVIYGEWIKTDSMPRSAKCSECNCWITRHSINENWFRYCPHCGAKMNKKENRI